MIYFVRGGTSVKIGFVENRNMLQDRLSSLQTGSPLVLSILGIMEGDRRAEQELHVKYASIRYLNEWFHLTSEIVDFIEENCRPFITNIDRSNLYQPSAQIARARPLPPSLRRLKSVPMRDGLIKDFIRDCVRPGVLCSAASMHKALLEYSARDNPNGDLPSKKALGDHLTKEGVTRTKYGGMSYYRATLVINNVCPQTDSAKEAAVEGLQGVARA